MKQLDRSAVHVCLITEELTEFGASGGIGAAFHELALSLSAKSIKVDILYCPIVSDFSIVNYKNEINHYANLGVKLNILNFKMFVNHPDSYEKKSYAIAQWLLQTTTAYSHIHFHDYKGLGYFSITMKRQGLGLTTSELIVQLHGPTRWTIESNNKYFSHKDQLKIDFMEKKSIAAADCVVSPSKYLIDWLIDNSFDLPNRKYVIKNVCTNLTKNLQIYSRKNSPDKNKVSDIILFARHEDRKGISIFFDALSLLKNKIVESNVKVTLIGSFGYINSQHSGLFIYEALKKLNFPIVLRSGWSRSIVAQYISTRSSPVVVVPSPVENSPYTVLETLALNCPIICSRAGGGSELFKNSKYSGLIEMTPSNLANKISYSIDHGLSSPEISENFELIENRWLNFHTNRTPHSYKKRYVSKKINPLVTVAITHFERPTKLIDVIFSVFRQTYNYIELIVVDDGSHSPNTKKALVGIESTVKRLNGILIKTENRYLGAARNAALKIANGDYICFIDDDDIAISDMLEKLVTAAVNTGADVVTGASAYMQICERGNIISQATGASIKADYVPIGGPLSLATIENCFGSATSLIKTAVIREIGGYSELKNVGHEDYELYIKLVQAGRSLTTIPFPLIHYEIGRPSMISKTSPVSNFRRCFNSISFQENTDAWADFINLKTGENVEVNAHNKIYWLNSLESNAELRNKIFLNNTDREQILIDLMELAEKENRLNLKSIFMSDLNDVEMSTQDDFSYSQETVFNRSAQDSFLSDSSVDLWSVRLDILLGRVENALTSLSAVVTSKKIITKYILELISLILSEAKNQSLDSNLWRKFVNDLIGAKVQGEQKISYLLNISKIFLIINDVDSATDAAYLIIKMEEIQYCSNNSDVANEKKNGKVQLGLEHFNQFGVFEGRSGFSLFEDIKSFANINCSKNTIIDQFQKNIISRLHLDFETNKGTKFDEVSSSIF